MARARSIKPGLYKNEQLAECSVWARYLFPGLWMIADREGRLEDRPKRIKAELLPFDTQDVEPLLRELEAGGFIVRYQIDGASYIQISKFLAHQSPHYSEKPSGIKPPPPPEIDQHIDPSNSGSPHTMIQVPVSECSEKHPGMKRGSQRPSSLTPSSLTPDSRLPVKAPRLNGAAPRAPKPVKLPLPPGFTVSERVRSWAEQKGYSRLDEHLEAFKRKATMNAYVYTDWDLAFMEAVREDWAKLRNGLQPVSFDYSTLKD